MSKYLGTYSYNESIDKTNPQLLSLSLSPLPMRIRGDKEGGPRVEGLVGGAGREGGKARWWSLV